MPELPEVETVRRGIERHVVGRLIERVEIGRERSVRRTGPEAVVHGLTGATMTAAGRRGKYLVCSLDTGEAVMIHLRMSGRVLVRPVGDDRPPHCHVVLTLSAGESGTRDEMWFVDPRTFGEVVVFDPGSADEIIPELGRLGPDPVLDRFDGEVLAERLRGRRAPIKQVLLDQHVVAGIGNIYADEVLHRARVRGDRPADALARRTINRLADVIVEVISAAIEAGGSTLDDTQYVDVSGETGRFQHEHRVYGRAGLPCVTCGKGVVKRAMRGGRSSSWCPVCQPR
ncbi:MAG: formamidopyrimidine-DNA glycosylase/DNA-(apurinic or apyrimidinic site) lyase [Actinomycetota bacterium]